MQQLDFFARPGYRITGYEFSFGGELRVTGIAHVFMNGGLMGNSNPSTTLDFGATDEWIPYTFTTSIGTDAYAGGPVTAQGSISYVAPTIFDYTYDDEGNINGVIQEWVGTANVFLDRVSVRALVTPVPEPETYLMLLAGLGAVAWRVRRDTGPSAMA
jgi:Ca2+-binding RTX toxin-like protein